jgi:ubiquinone/menaquinone biosynthesis C-methylase UbiE
MVGLFSELRTQNSELRTQNSELRTMIPTLWQRIVRFGFYLLYNQFAWTYDLVSSVVSFGQWRCWTQQALPYLRAGARVLELAHGTGNLQLDLHAAGFHSVGLDLSRHMGRIARGKLRRAGIVPSLVRGKAAALPFATATFDAIVCTFPAPFILHADTLAEVQRVLRDDGQMIIVPNATLTGGDAATAAVELLYRATGQRGGAGFDVVGYFAHHGFDARVEMKPCKRSVVQVIVCQKHTGLAKNSQEFLI